MYSAIGANKRNTFVIIGLFLVIIGGLGWLAGAVYQSNAIFYMAIVIAGFYALIQYFAAARLAIAMNGGQEIEKKDNPRLWRVVENLAITNGMPMPRVFVVNDPAPNAFATGRDPSHAYVCATTGLLDIMDDTELESVMAHEMGHVKNYDIRVMMIVFGLVSAIGILADMFMRMMWFRDDERDTPPALMIFGIVAAILAPIVAALIQLAVSRQREYLADATSAMTTRYPDGLISALKKLEQYGRPLKRQNSSTAHLFFSNPLKGGSLAALFSTHPPIPDRIKRLQEMGSKL